MSELPQVSTKKYVTYNVPKLSLLCLKTSFVGFTFALHELSKLYLMVFKIRRHKFLDLGTHRHIETCWQTFEARPKERFQCGSDKPFKVAPKCCVDFAIIKFWQVFRSLWAGGKNVQTGAVVNSFDMVIFFRRLKRRSAFLLYTCTYLLPTYVLHTYLILVMHRLKSMYLSTNL